jgi:Pre-mRNA 3'-end-processing endonuclease polyadenylation factor C-term
MASPPGDVIADSVVALIMHAQSSSASIRLTSRPCRHPRDDEPPDDEDAAKKQRSDAIDLAKGRLRYLYFALKDQFEHVEATYEGNLGTFEITTDSGLEGAELDDDGRLRCVVEARLEGNSASGAEIKVESKDSALAANVQACLRNIVAAFTPLET